MAGQVMEASGRPVRFDEGDASFVIRAAYAVECVLYCDGDGKRVLAGGLCFSHSTNQLGGYSITIRDRVPSTSPRY
jgi:hypothetical protein